VIPQSLEPLALVALKEAGAEGCAIYQLDPAGQRELKFGWGMPPLNPGDSEHKIASFPLRVGDEVNGVLSFVFRGTVIPPRAQSMVERIAGAIEEVWKLSLLAATYARHAARVGELESELADSKIADRARGMLAGSTPPRDAVDTIVRHVESVLRPGPLGIALEQRNEELEQEIVERELTNRAKAVLQSRYGMSEDQAHVHLRVVSRKSRKRLPDVARDLLEETAVSGR
jgi:hypothetical protein